MVNASQRTVSRQLLLAATLQDPLFGREAAEALGEKGIQLAGLEAAQVDREPKRPVVSPPSL
jgi:hypothetical protein